MKHSEKNENFFMAQNHNTFWLSKKLFLNIDMNWLVLKITNCLLCKGWLHIHFEIKQCTGIQYHQVAISARKVLNFIRNCQILFIILWNTAMLVNLVSILIYPAGGALS